MKKSLRAEPFGTFLQRPIEASDLMLATLRRRPFSHPGWLYELKYKYVPRSVAFP